MTRKRQNARRRAAGPAVSRLLPAALLRTELSGLDVRAELLERCAERSITSVGDLLALPARAFGRTGWLGADDVEVLRTALATALHTGSGDDARDHRTFREQLEAPLEPGERELLGLLVGADGTTMPRTAIAARLDISLPRLDENARQVRARLHERLPALLGRLRYEVGGELATNGGIFDPRLAAADSIVHRLGAEGPDPLLGARVAAFLFPREFHLHRGLLCQMAPRRFRRLLRTLPRVVRPQRLPLPIDALLTELAAEQIQVPRGLLLHLLARELRVAITHDPAAGEVAVPDPASAEKRLVDLLIEAGRPMQLDDLVFDYRERFRRASRCRLEERLRSSPTFVMVGPETWSLRDRHGKDLLAATPLADRIARRICAEGGRQNVAMLLADERPDDRTIWLVLDRLAVDPRVRLLGRGDVCPATHRQSQVLERLLADFRRAAGDVVMSLFVQNQPPHLHRLVERLLRQNRLFVIPAPDRIDLLTNYPFDPARLRRLVTIVDQQLQARSGYAPVEVLKTALDGTDLGGSWLTTDLLGDLLRRHGPFEVLPGNLVARRELAIGRFVMSSVRQALREVGGPLTVDDILQQRPDLAEFAVCLRELLAADPLVQSPDGAYFSLV